MNFSDLKISVQRGLARVAKSLGLGQFMPGPRDQRPVVFLDPNYDYASMENAYKVNPWIHAAVDSRAVKLADLPLRLYREIRVGSEVEREEVFDHPLVELFYRPNKLQSAFEFFRDIESELCLAGETFIFAENGSQGMRLTGTIKSLHLLHPRFVKRIVSPMHGMVTAYEYDQGGSPRMFPAEFVTHAKMYNPESDLRGLPPLEVARFPYLMKYYMDMYNINFFKNGGHPKMALSSKGRVSPESKEANTREFQKHFMGYQNNGKIPHFDSETTLLMLATSAKDGEFINFDVMKRDEVLAIYKTPPVMVGVDESTYANAHEQRRAFYELGVSPDCNLIESAINRQIVDVWYGGQGLYFEFDLSGVEALQADMLKRAQIDKIYLDAGKVTINELRTRDNEDAVAWGDEPYNALASAFGIGGGSVNAGAGDDDPIPPAKSINRKSVDRLRKSEEGRADLWRELIAPVVKYENRFEATQVDYFNGQLKRIEARIAELYGVTLSAGSGYYERQTLGPNDLQAIFNASAEDDLLRQAVVPIYRAIVQTAGKNAVAQVGAGVEFNVTDPRVVELIGRKVGMITRINNTTRELLNNLLTTSALLNRTVEETAREISMMYEGFTPARSRMIARTEVIGANNGATVEGFRQSGVGMKEWLSSRDADVRESHAAIDGVKVGIDQLFPNGVAFPGGDGPADETINCRCTILAVV